MLRQKAKARLNKLRENLKKRIISAFMDISPQSSDIGSYFYVRHTPSNNGDGSQRLKKSSQDSSATRQDSGTNHQGSRAAHQESLARQSIPELDIQDSSQSKRRKPLIIDQSAVKKPEKSVLNAEASFRKVVDSSALSFQQQKALKTYSDNQASSYLLDQDIEVVHRFDRYA